MNLERILKKLAKNNASAPTKKLKVLHIPTSGVNAGGITKFIFDTMGEQSVKNKLECYILSPIDVEPSFKKRLTVLGTTLVIFNERTRSPHIYFFKLLSYLRKNEFDLIHVHGSSSLMSLELLAAKLAGIKVRIAHSHNTTCDHQTLHKLLKPLFLRSYTHALACSQAAGEWLFLNKPFEVIYNGVDLKRLSFSKENRTALRKKLGLSADALVLGHVGHFNRQKNHHFLLDIFQEVARLDESARLILIGSGKLENEIKQKARQLQLSDKILFIGNVDDVENYFSAMDAFVLPSLFEGFSIVLAEAQANGLASFASDRIPETVAITNKIHFLSLENSDKYWADKILAKHDVFHHLSEKDKDALKVFDVHIISRSLYKKYLQFLAD